ncbi:YorP family protein [Bacillus sonorensis]|uniref:YorP family protein n=1 Tax=Bacillus sonorensis TaxID=119858 RepID=UPI001F326BE3|nr:YorP family protein [Bacillus sonorensis]MCF7618568.1 YorP family protein [Bacillus sonorensis]MCY7858789.1 YorP family protein [Bacillus sonorensis]MCY8034137.1 YorP family protein [Bacillus sonorensis]MCY8564275.1 YorP family protein [Bacillus sonorensis]MEC1437336.1 YorP family protein [Bacillus sonorensis]
MPKYWSYDINDEVEVNSNAKYGMPSFIGLKGIIIDRINSWQYDYDVLHFSNGEVGRYKESELNLIHKASDTY